MLSQTSLPASNLNNLTSKRRQTQKSKDTLPSTRFKNRLTTSANLWYQLKHNTCLCTTMVIRRTPSLALSLKMWQALRHYRSNLQKACSKLNPPTTAMYACVDRTATMTSFSNRVSKKHLINNQKKRKKMAVAMNSRRNFSRWLRRHLVSILTKQGAGSGRLAKLSVTSTYSS